MNENDVMLFSLGKPIPRLSMDQMKNLWLIIAECVYRILLWEHKGALNLEIHAGCVRYGCPLGGNGLQEYTLFLTNGA